jgi:uncharacterized protein (DUF169 family)
MSDYKKIADDVTRSLQLSQPPIALSFAHVSPSGIRPFNDVVPAGCSFWQLAATSTFYTSAKDHELCSIGIYTHHLAEPSPAHESELQNALEAMSGLDYIRPDEVAAIPVVQQAVKYVVYGPLVELRSDPDVVLLFAHAEQSLIVSEAVSRVDKGIPPAMGRPACAVVPQVLNTGRAAMSLGCCGARAYLDVLSENYRCGHSQGKSWSSIARKSRRSRAPTKSSRRFTRGAEQTSGPASGQPCASLSIAWDRRCT